MDKEFLVSVRLLLKRGPPRHCDLVNILKVRCHAKNPRESSYHQRRRRLHHRRRSRHHASSVLSWNRDDDGRRLELTCLFLSQLQWKWWLRIAHVRSILF